MGTSLLLLLKTSRIFLLICALSLRYGETAVSWAEWWSHDGISGPDFWGLVNGEWTLCELGKRQSPIDIPLETLLFDPLLDDVVVEQKDPMEGTLMNQGNVFKLLFKQPEVHRTKRKAFLPFNSFARLSGGPLPYNYEISEISFHHGATDNVGSEHSINNMTFPAEIQIIAYNSDLYPNFTTALPSAHGIAILSLLAQKREKGNEEMDKVIRVIDSVLYSNTQADIQNFTITNLIPPNSNYVTYQGSMTRPGCQETVTWIILNKPLSLSQSQLHALRRLQKSDAQGNNGLLSNNVRTRQDSNKRVVSTNIDFQQQNEHCTMNRANFFYKMNDK